MSRYMYPNQRDRAAEADGAELEELKHKLGKGIGQTLAHVAAHALILIGAPTAFQPECPLFMYFASNPASRSLIAVLQPT